VGDVIVAAVTRGNGTLRVVFHGMDRMDEAGQPGGRQGALGSLVVRAKRELANVPVQTSIACRGVW
jgi:hypothetical protein